MYATCRECKKKIKHLAIRGCQKNFSYNDYFCEKCTEKQLDEACDKIEQIKKDFEKFKKMSIKKREEYLYKLKILKEL